MADVLVERDGCILTVTLNRPEKRNALTLESFETLKKAAAEAAADDRVRVVVLRGAGDKAFSSGIDLALLFEILSSNPTGMQIRSTLRGFQDAFTAFELLEKPTIAAIEGACVGGGLELALACDLRIASSAAVFGMPESKIGMLPDLGGTTRLSRVIGASRAKEWIFTGKSYPAVRALELGLINDLVVPKDAFIRAKHLANEIAANGPLALAWGKRVVDRGLQMSLRDSLELEQDAMTEILPSAELKEGVQAFLEKRLPVFTKG